MGNILGSNIANIFLIFGALGVVYPMEGFGKIVSIDLPVLWLFVGYLFFLRNKKEFSRGSGFLILGSFLAYLAYLGILTK